MKYKYSMIHLAVDTKYRSLASVWFNPQFPPRCRPRGSVVAGAACRDYDPTLGQPALHMPSAGYYFYIRLDMLPETCSSGIGTAAYIVLMLASPKIVVLLF